MNQDNSNSPVTPDAPGRNFADRDDDAIDLGEIIAVLLDYKWVIITLTALALAIGVAFAWVATPIYRADALVQIEDKSGAQGGLAWLQDVESALGETTSVAAELEILRSRMILGRVTDRLNLTIVVEPVRAPLIGDAVARRYGGGEPSTPLFGLDQYAWGGERIRVERFDVPNRLQGQSFQLTAAEADRFTLADAEGNTVLEGQVGIPAANGSVSLFVSELVARPGTNFTVRRISREEAIASLRERFQASERGGRGRASGVVELALSGPNRQSLSTELDEILNAYVRQNVEYRSAEAEKTLEFLEQQLPLLKAQLDEAEAVYNDYRQVRGSVDLTLETQSVLSSIVTVDNEIIGLQQQREELRQRFTAEHPRVQTVDAQIRRLRDRRAQLDSSVTRLPETQQVALQLARDVEVATALYTGLLNSTQQLRVARAGTVGDVRIIDSAVVAATPIAPRKRFIVLVAGVLGVLLSLGLVWLRRATHTVVEEPESIERHLALPVYATVPFSKAEALIQRRIGRGRQAEDQLLALLRPDDDAVESLRSLRTTLHFALLGGSRKSVLLTGSAPGVGKSFVAANLAAVLAQAGKRVILVDADLRKGHMHESFGIVRRGGVSDYVSGRGEFSEVMSATPLPGLWFVPTGQIPPNPSELLMHPRFASLLQTLEESCDVLIVDAPPVLAVSDAIIIGRHVGATLLVARAGRHPISELEQAVKRFSQAGIAVKGFVFNGFDTRRQRYRYGYRGYQYQYKYSKGSAG